MEDEKEVLKKRLLELTPGVTIPPNIGVATLKTRIAEAESLLKLEKGNEGDGASNGNGGSEILKKGISAEDLTNDTANDGAYVKAGVVVGDTPEQVKEKLDLFNNPNLSNLFVTDKNIIDFHNAGPAGISIGMYYEDAKKLSQDHSAKSINLNAQTGAGNTEATITVEDLQQFPILGLSGVTLGEFVSSANKKVEDYKNAQESKANQETELHNKREVKYGKNYVVATNKNLGSGEIETVFSEITWNGLSKKDKDGWKRKTSTPPEVAALQNK